MISDPLLCQRVRSSGYSPQITCYTVNKEEERTWEIRFSFEKARPKKKLNAGFSSNKPMLQNSMQRNHVIKDWFGVQVPIRNQYLFTWFFCMGFSDKIGICYIWKHCNIMFLSLFMETSYKNPIWWCFFRGFLGLFFYDVPWNMKLWVRSMTIHHLSLF